MKFLKKYGVNIKNKDLLLEALTHSSYANEHSVKDYERLEFLGDAVLQIIMSEYFYLNTSLNEGDMSKIRASYVCEPALCQYSKDLGLLPFIRVGQGQLKNINDTIIADIFESIIGAIYLSNGLKDVKKVIYEVVIPYIKKEHVFLADYKSLLQEMVQTDKKSLEYVLVNEKGPAHSKTFSVEVRIDNIIFGKGKGKSKKEAEQAAAYDAFRKSAKQIRKD